jgi:hypothetical protein
MVDLIFNKTIAKALDINDIIEKIMGMCSISPNLTINNQIRPPIEIQK